MPRITWLDSCRGLAILFLIAIHYVGALESRSYISEDLLHLIKAFFRVATPFFIFTFGFTFYIAYQKRLVSNTLSSIYNRSLFSKLVYILMAREAITIILAFRYPSLEDKIFDVLTFQSFSMGGEILIFYFFAILVAPLNLKFLLKTNYSIYIITWVVIYSCSYFIGINYFTEESHGIYRFLFYDMYPFFPFLFVMACGMLMAEVYKNLPTDLQRLKFYSLISISFILSALIGFNVISDTVISDLSLGVFKTPPNLFYILFYLGITLSVIIVLATLLKKNLIPKPINNALSIIGKNSLLAYVLHYTFFMSSYVTKYYKLNSIIEICAFIFMLVFSYLILVYWNTYKDSKKLNKLQGKL